jgi:alpha-L-fucosidase
MTLNGTWGYSQHDRKWKSAETLIRNTIDIASKGGNYLINAGPLADGSIPEAIRVRFLELGAWMKVCGESIYGTGANPLGAVTWGRITVKPGKFYLHVFDWPKDNQLLVPLNRTRQTSSYMLADGQRRPLNSQSTEKGLVLTLLPRFQNPYASVVVLEAEGTPIGGAAK